MLSVSKRFPASTMEKDKNKAPQEDLDAAQISYQELKLKYDADDVAETLQGEVKVSHGPCGAGRINSLKPEMDVLHQQMEQETTILQQKSKETEMCLWVELQQIKVSYKEQSN